MSPQCKVAVVYLPWKGSQHFSLLRKLNTTSVKPELQEAQELAGVAKLKLGSSSSWGWCSFSLPTPRLPLHSLCQRQWRAKHCECEVKVGAAPSTKLGTHPSSSLPCASRWSCQDITCPWSIPPVAMESRSHAATSKPVCSFQKALGSMRSYTALRCCLATSSCCDGVTVGLDFHLRAFLCLLDELGAGLRKQESLLSGWCSKALHFHSLHTSCDVGLHAKSHSPCNRDAQSFPVLLT